MGAQPQPEGGTGQSADDVRAHLARLLASAAFPASGRRRKLLEYAVEQTLAGRGERLKAYDLAVSVLGRDASFDPQGDPIVRIEMGRLRRDLDHYYVSEGRAEPVRITIPKGHYAPVIETLAEASASEPGRPVPAIQRPVARYRVGIAAALCALAVVASVGFWVLWWGSVDHSRRTPPCSLCRSSPWRVARAEGSWQAA